MGVGVISISRPHLGVGRWKKGSFWKGGHIICQWQFSYVISAAPAPPPPPLLPPVFLTNSKMKKNPASGVLFGKCFLLTINFQLMYWNLFFLGSVVYEKLCSTLTKSSLVKGIKQASPFAQTSCLEGFHSVLNQFAPKMIAYSYLGMYCRYEFSFQPH